jgi:hypothetical protein
MHYSASRFANITGIGFGAEGSLVETGGYSLQGLKPSYELGRDEMEALAKAAAGALRIWTKSTKVRHQLTALNL